MKRMLFFFAVTLLAACANQNNSQVTDNTKDGTTAVTEHVVDWTKPQYCLDMHGDTIAQWIYGPTGQLSQLYILGQLYEGDFDGEDTVDGNYCKFDAKGRLKAIVTSDDYASYRYEFTYGYEEDEEENEDDDDEWYSGYKEKDIEMEYDVLGRVTSITFRIRWSVFSANLSYDESSCYVDAVFSVPEMDELGIPIGTGFNESYYEYNIFY